jgi:hypothetical protein
MLMGGLLFGNNQLRISSELFRAGDAAILPTRINSLPVATVLRQIKESYVSQRSSAFGRRAHGAEIAQGPPP